MRKRTCIPKTKVDASRVVDFGNESSLSAEGGRAKNSFSRFASRNLVHARNSSRKDDANHAAASTVDIADLRKVTFDCAIGFGTYTLSGPALASGPHVVTGIGIPGELHSGTFFYFAGEASAFIRWEAGEFAFAVLDFS